MPGEEPELWGKSEISNFEGAPWKHQKEWDSGVRGALRERRRAGWWSCFLTSSKRLAPRGDSMGNRGTGVLVQLSSAWESRERSWWPHWHRGVGTMRLQAAHSCMNCMGLCWTCAISGTCMILRFGCGYPLNWISSHLCLSGLPTCN